MQREDFAAHYPATLYDHYSERFLDAYDYWIIRRLMQLLRDPSADATLLDIGAGTARLLCKIGRQKFAQHLTLIGLDYFHEMVEIARKNVEQASLSQRILIGQSDVHNLPFANGTVRYVLSRSTVHHWRDPVSALWEIHRVLEPRGLALIYEISRTATTDAMAKFNDLRRMANIEPSRMDEKYTPEELWQFVTAAGLEANAELRAPKMGWMALGMELQIRKD